MIVNVVISFVSVFCVVWCYCWMRYYWSVDRGELLRQVDHLEALAGTGGDRARREVAAELRRIAVNSARSAMLAECQRYLAAADTIEMKIREPRTEIEQLQVRTSV